MDNQTVLVLDFGGQYKDLIARRVREQQVHSLILPGSASPERIRQLAPIGIILTGGPNSVYEEGAPSCSSELFQLGIPVLGICYGAHLMTHVLGGQVAAAEKREYGPVEITLDALEPGRRELPASSECSGGRAATSADAEATDAALLFRGLPRQQQVLMSHGDQVVQPAPGFRRLAHSVTCPDAALADPSRKLYALQFHPEVEHTAFGREILHNFLYGICGAAGTYTMEDFIEKQVAAVQAQAGGEKVLLGLSGGVDSSVCAALLSKALPGRVVCVFVDHGLMRKNEGDEIEAVFSKRPVEFIRVNAQERFLKALEGIEDPETKRKIIGREFVAVFEEQAQALADVKYLAQGTIYPDVIESGVGEAATIKSHHNVGGLPENMRFAGIVEPLRDLFKDEVRALGRKLGLPSQLVERQPFPGPGLGVRIIGEITRDKLALLREADAIFREELEAAGAAADQYFAVLTDLRSVGVMGDGRTYDYTVALRAVKTSDFMTCSYVHLPYELLDRVSSRIINEVPHVNRIVYDITGKPPATIEWL